MGKSRMQINIQIDENNCHNCISHKKTKCGYIRVNRKRKSLLLHRIVYSENYLNGEDIPNGLLVRHKCDNPACINPEHLELGTKKDNSDDKMKRGRFRNGADMHNGENHANSILTEQQVKEIFVSNEKRIELSKKYGVHKEHIGKIQRGKAWVRITKYL